VGVSTASFAERVFQALDQTSKPELFLVSIRADENAERFPACVEPGTGLLDFTQNTSTMSQLSWLDQELYFLGMTHL